MSDKPSILDELKRRNVIRFAGLYLVGAWLLTQVSSTVLPMFGAPDWLPRSIVILLAIAFVPALIFSWVFELTPQGLKRDEDVKPEESIQPQTARRMDRIIIAALVLALGYFVFDKFELAPRRVTALPNESGTTANAKSIAVLPFDNLSRDPDNAYFCEGVQDEILTSLAKVADLKVISRTSTQHFKSSPDNLPQIARQLGVAHILEGSVQKASDQIRVNVQLINALTDAHLWAETYDRKLTDIFAIESEIAKSVAENLQARLNGHAQAVLAARPTGNLEAHELYLRGRYLWNRRSTASLRKAGDYFQQAIKLDPNYALAYAGLADVHSLLPIYAGTAPKDDVPKALDAAHKAVELDSNLAEAHTSLGNALGMNVQLRLAEPEFRRALELNANYATAHQWLAECLFSLGRFPESLAENERAHELDPLSLIINASYAASLSGVGRHDDAVKQAHKTIDLDPALVPGHEILGQIYEEGGKLEEAIAEYGKATALESTPANLAMLAHAFGKTGRMEEVQKILNKLTALSAQQYVGAYPLAIVHLALGEKEEALRLLEQSFVERDFLLQGLFGSVTMDKRLDPLRNDPRFQKLVARFDAGIPE